MKDCVFQFSTADGEIIENTDLITRADAVGLWKSYIDKFKDQVSSGRAPEMCIWIDMDNVDDFKKTAVHWCGEDFIVIDGKMFMPVPLTTPEVSNG